MMILVQVINTVRNMTNLKTTFEYYELRANFIREYVDEHRDYGDVAKTDLYNKLTRNAKELSRMAHAACCSMDPIYNEGQAEDEYQVMLSTCDQYFELIEKTIHELPPDKVMEWQNALEKYLSDNIIQLQEKLRVANEGFKQFHCWKREPNQDLVNH